MAIRAFDVLYVPSRDVAADLAFYRDVLGARVVFAIEAMGTRVDDLEATLAELSELEIEARVELPLGPCATLHTPGGQRLGFYELTRPEVDTGFAGRFDCG